MVLLKRRFFWGNPNIFGFPFLSHSCSISLYNFKHCFSEGSVPRTVRRFMKLKICWKPSMACRKLPGLLLLTTIAIHSLSITVHQSSFVPLWQACVHLFDLLMAEYWKTTKGSRRKAMRPKWRAWNWKWTTSKMRTASCKTCSRRKVMSMRIFAKRCPGSAVRTQCVIAFFNPYFISWGRWGAEHAMICAFPCLMWSTGYTRAETAGFRAAETKTRIRGPCRRTEQRTSR